VFVCFRSREHGARFPGVITHRDDHIEGLSPIAIKGLAVVVRDVDADLCHRWDGERSDARSLGPGRVR
jgi:hypothetical protein